MEKLLSVQTSNSQVPVYIAEISPPNLRGGLVSVHQVG